MLKDIAIGMLSENYLLHVDMLECIRRGSAEILYASEEGVLLVDIPSQVFMISAFNNHTSENLISKIPDSAEIIAAHDKFSYDSLLKKHDYSARMICHNTVYTKKTLIPVENFDIKIKHLNTDYKDTIISNYTKAEVVDSNYIEERLKANVMLGAFINNDLCGFIGNHSEGSIGMLEVFLKYRGNGIGMALQIAATNDSLANKRYAYGQVVEGNLASTKLQKKLGFELSKDRVYWLIR
ncbi:hypothetical protein B0P06_000693 [Clostridium saccharoperbutylacetonicum]|uniref:GCN5-related N-acetyltransferase n=1 Tax=Clostridium saccharoperbutylacetonicum N1-4(HMT) TaxID=931276 RepID=M1MFT1_9CLOT|nr:GNAT family N-acetyltransferase [Clostridium saccharoperbutylacetonicum]AGF55223.1 GCN5-related N-acetyltransferase [Clostridium saccharoperbutylacetonicum N1-4(HMT)]NRT64066.1 hypothetical protein [Clostridium saccharoperbutylacetonicum]NSB27433.1 hypothetical protein [Clostridium saccharoperbutylacetonicum]NSB40922.1 hypothetical protein [Clostridium saccharoperbutylacetonicum]